MDAKCPECLGRYRDGLSCFEQMGQIIAWEYQDPELAAEHFCTVASYNLQHPAMFTSEALTGLKTAFDEYLRGAVSTEGIRKRFRKLYEGHSRVLLPESERQTHPRSWRMTIADVYLPGQAKGAADRVRAWAETIRNEW